MKNINCINTIINGLYKRKKKKIHKQNNKLMNRPQVKLRESEHLLDSSSYDPNTTEIVILNTPSYIGSLYHEYRHHWQFCNLPSIILLWVFFGMISVYPYIILNFIFYIFKLKFLVILSSVIYLILILSCFAIEVDANIFAIRRIILKKRPLFNIILLIFSLLTYFFTYIFYPLSVIKSALSW